MPLVSGCLALAQRLGRCAKGTSNLKELIFYFGYIILAVRGLRHGLQSLFRQSRDSIDEDRRRPIAGGLVIGGSIWHSQLRARIHQAIFDRFEGLLSVLEECLVFICAHVGLLGNLNQMRNVGFCCCVVVVPFGLDGVNLRFCCRYFLRHLSDLGISLRQGIFVFFSVFALA